SRFCNIGSGLNVVFTELALTLINHLIPTLLSNKFVVRAFLFNLTLVQYQNMVNFYQVGLELSDQQHRFVAVMPL
ncbi:hypothetical protein, partial [Vibrio echinoideorum]